MYCFFSVFTLIIDLFVIIFSTITSEYVSVQYVTVCVQFMVNSVSESLKSELVRFCTQSNATFVVYIVINL